MDGFVKRKTSGFYFDKATGITIRNCSLQWGTIKPAYFPHAVESYGVSNVSVFNLVGTAAPVKLKAQVIKK